MRLIEIQYRTAIVKLAGLARRHVLDAPAAHSKSVLGVDSVRHVQIIQDALLLMEKR